jgi:hypothetical protein
MAADYRKFKTPFYEIEVGDSDWKRIVKLPHHIMRLVEKVEINENLMLNSDETPTSMSITFIEGSREPASQDYNLGTSGLYQVPLEGNDTDADISGSMTNRAGLITDLRFSGSGGITWLTEEEKKTGKVDNKQQKNVDGKNTTREYKTEPRPPTFLFQERNRIRVTWGYVEDPPTVRSIMMDIRVVTTEFPQEGMPKTVITGFSFPSIGNQMATRRGKPFATKRITSKAGDSMIEFEDLKTDVLIKRIAEQGNMAAIVSENVFNETTDKDKQKMWLAGESFHEFMKRMADNSGCYYEILSDQNTGKQIIIFIKYTDFEKNLVVKDKELLNWKGPGSILKSVNVTADFGGMQGSRQSGFDEEGKETSATDEVPVELLVKDENQKAIATSPIQDNPNPTAVAIAENIANEGITGTVNIDPGVSVINKNQKAGLEAKKNAKLIAIDFNTIGYTRLIPGVMEITGIGVRYSGRYRILNVTHILDSSGYTCKCTGDSEMIASGGVTIPSGAESAAQNQSVYTNLLDPKNTPKKDRSKFGDQKEVLNAHGQYVRHKYKQIER